MEEPVQAQAVNGMGGAVGGATPTYIQVLGLSALATLAQLNELFGLAGPVESLELFWLEGVAVATPGTLVGFIKCVNSPPPPPPPTHTHPPTHMYTQSHTLSCF